MATAWPPDQVSGSRAGGGGARATIEREPALVVRRPELLHGRTFRITGRTVTIGRAAGNDVVLDDPLVSRRHATLSRAGRAVLIEDSDSSNGTAVNGVPIVEPTLLHAGDRIQLGNAELELVGDPVPTRTPAGVPGAVVMVDHLPGDVHRHRVRRAVAYAVGAVLLLLAYVSLLPVIAFAAFTAILTVDGARFWEGGAEPADLLALAALVGLVVLAAVLWRLGLRLVRGNRHLVLFLRKFGFSGAAEALTVAIGAGVGRHWRLVTLDDHDLAPVGVGSGSRWVVRVVRLALVAGLVAAAVVAYRFITGDSVDQAVNDTYAEMTAEGENDLAAAVGAAIGSALIGVLMTVIVVVMWSIAISVTGVAAMLLSFTAHSARHAEKAKAIVVERDAEIENVVRSVRRRVRKVLAPRITVVRVTDPLWRQVVRRFAAISDVVLVDVSRPTDNLLWEVEALERTGTRWLAIGEIDCLDTLAAAPDGPGRRLSDLLGPRPVVGYRPERLSDFTRGLRRSLDVAALGHRR